MQSSKYPLLANGWHPAVASKGRDYRHWMATCTDTSVVYMRQGLGRMVLSTLLFSKGPVNLENSGAAPVSLDNFTTDSHFAAQDRPFESKTEL